MARDPRSALGTGPRRRLLFFGGDFFYGGYGCDADDDDGYDDGHDVALHPQSHYHPHRKSLELIPI